MQTPTRYNPDVLSCLANLSNDEVFTPPAVVNRMLDLLPPGVVEQSARHLPRPRMQDGRLPPRDSQTPHGGTGPANTRCAGACQPHYDPPALRSGHHGADCPALPPQRLLQQAGEWSLLRLRDLCRPAREHLLHAPTTYLGTGPMPLLRCQPGGVRTRRESRDVCLSVHSYPQSGKDIQYEV